MTADEAVSRWLALGAKDATQPRWDEGRTHLMLPRIAGPVCGGNDRAPGVGVLVYRDLVPGQPMTTQFEIVGERAGVWFKLEAYSMPHAEALMRRRAVIAALTRAWSAL